MNYFLDLVVTHLRLMPGRLSRNNTRAFSKYFARYGNKVSRLKILCILLQMRCLRIFNLGLQPLVMPDIGKLSHVRFDKAPNMLQNL